MNEKDVSASVSSVAELQPLNTKRRATGHDGREKKQEALRPLTREQSVRRRRVADHSGR